MVKSKTGIITDGQISHLQKIYTGVHGFNSQSEKKKELNNVAKVIAEKATNGMTIAHVIASDDPQRYQKKTEAGLYSVFSTLYYGYCYQAEMIQMLNEYMGTKTHEKLVNSADKNGNTPLHYAVQNDYNADLVKGLINIDELDTSKKNNNGRTAYFEAVANGYYNNATVFVEDPNEIDTEVGFVLRENKPLISTNDESYTMRDKSGKTMLHAALEKGNLIKAIEFLSNIYGDDKNIIIKNSIDKDGNNLLHAAASSGNLEAVKSLIEALKDNDNFISQVINLRNKEKQSSSHIGSNGFTPLEYAVKNNHVSIVEFLLNNENINLDLEPEYIKNLIKMAATSTADIDKNAASIRSLISYALTKQSQNSNRHSTQQNKGKPNDNFTVFDTLEYLSSLGNSTIFELLADDAITKGQNANELMLRAAFEGNLTTVKHIIDKHQGDINAQDIKFTKSALDYFGTTYVNVDAAKDLITKNIAADASNFVDSIATKNLLNSERESLEILLHTILLKAAKREDTLNKSGLYYAIKYGMQEEAAVLAKNISLMNDDEKKKIENEYDEIIDLAISNKMRNMVIALLSSQQSYGQSTLFYAIQHKQTNVGKFLINSATENEKKDIFTNVFKYIEEAIEKDKGEIAITLIEFIQTNSKNQLHDFDATGPSASNIDRHIAKLCEAALGKKQYDIVNKLLNFYHDYATKNFDEGEKQTLLNLAVQKFNLEVVKYLIEKKKCDINQQDGLSKKTPLYHAILEGKPKIVQFLLSQKELQPFDGEGPKNLIDIVVKNESQHLDTIDQIAVIKGLLKHEWSRAKVEQRDDVQFDALTFAVERGYTNAVTLLLEDKNYNIDAADKNGKTPLHIAIENNNEKIVELLIEKFLIARKIDDNSGEYSKKLLAFLKSATAQKSNEKTTDSSQLVNLILTYPTILKMSDSELLSTLSKACQEEGIPMVQPLLNFADNKANKEARGNKSILEMRDSDGITLLHQLVIEGKNETIKALIGNDNVEAQAKANIEDEEGRIPLHYAAKAGNIEIMELLIANKSEINKADKNKETPLHYAVRGGNADAVALLVKTPGIDINAVNLTEQNPIAIAIAIEIGLGYKTVKPILDNKNFSITTNELSTHLVAITKKPGMLNFFKELFVYNIKQKDVEDIEKFSILNDKQGLLRYCIVKESNPQYAYYLIQNDSDLDFTKFTKQEVTQLIKSAIQNDEHYIVQYLLEQSKLPEDQKNQIALIAIKADKLEALKHFINEKNKEELLFSACEYGTVEIVKHFVETLSMSVKDSKKENGASLLHIASYSGNISVAEYLEDKDLKHDVGRDKNGLHTIHYAALGGKLDMVKHIFDNDSIDIKIQDEEGRNALHHAICSNNTELIEYLIKDKKMDVNSKDNDGTTPLYYAIRIGSKEMLKYLLEEHNADLNAEDKAKNIALHHAVTFLIEELKNVNNTEEKAINKRFEIAEFLLEKWRKLDCGNQNHQTPLNLLQNAQKAIGDKKNVKAEAKSGFIAKFDEFVAKMQSKFQTLEKEEDEKERKANKIKTDEKRRNYAAYGAIIGAIDIAAGVIFTYTFGVSSIVGETIAATGLKLGAITFSHSFLATTACYGAVFGMAGLIVAAVLVAPYAAVCLYDAGNAVISVVDNIISASNTSELGQGAK